MYGPLEEHWFYQGSGMGFLHLIKSIKDNLDRHIAIVKSLLIWGIIMTTYNVVILSLHSVFSLFNIKQFFFKK